MEFYALILWYESLKNHNKLRVVWLLYLNMYCLYYVPSMNPVILTTDTLANLPHRSTWHKRLKLLHWSGEQHLPCSRSRCDFKLTLHIPEIDWPYSKFNMNPVICQSAAPFPMTYTLRRPVMREVLSTRIWGVATYCPSRPGKLPTAQAGPGNSPNSWWQNLTHDGTPKSVQD